MGGVGLDLFGGQGAIAAFWASKGVGSITLDTSLEPWMDLTSPTIQRIILGWIRSHDIAFVFLAPPCGSWSRCRRGPFGVRGPPGPLRSPDNILGFKNLPPHDLDKVLIGNSTMRFCVKVLRECAKQAVPCGLENPCSSLLWLAPPVAAVKAANFSKLVTLDQCQWRTPWRKPTSLLFVQTAGLDRLTKRCFFHKGRCSQSGRKHQQLAGINPSTKQFWTRQAQVYPADLAQDIGRVLWESSDRKFMNKIEDLIYG